MDYHVGDYVGFNLDEDAIHFGTLLPGVRADREIEIYTDKDVLINVVFEELDNIYVDKNNFVLKAGESYSLMFTIELPKDIEEGFYKGKIKIRFKKIL